MTPYLYAHPNPHAPRRGNGIRFHGYPSRKEHPRLIGVHTTESTFDITGADGGAEGVAAYQSRTDRPSSYHRIVDRDSTVMCLPDDATAFGIVGMNSFTLHLSLAMRGDDWATPSKARSAAAMLERAAQVGAEWCRRYDIPPRRVSRAQAVRGSRGFIAHGDADPDRRSDPGARFPWSTFLARVEQLLGQAAPRNDDTEELDMNEDTLRRIVGEEIDKRFTNLQRGEINGKPTGNVDTIKGVRAAIERLDVPRKPQ